MSIMDLTKVNIDATGLMADFKSASVISSIESQQFSSLDIKQSLPFWVTQGCERTSSRFIRVSGFLSNLANKKKYSTF